jgi:Mitochondrial carrier protein
MSGTFAVAATYPLDLIRTRQALDRRVPPRSTFCALRAVLRDEGGRALFRGLRPAILSHAPAGAIFFTLYTRLQTYVPVNSRSGQFAASAGIAWCTTCLVMNPMWVVKVGGNLTAAYR